MTTIWVSLNERLAAEWDVLAAATPGSVVHRWGREYPALAGVSRLSDVPGLVGPESDFQTRDAVLLALVSLTQDGSELAGRTVLHLLRPGLSRLMGDLARVMTRIRSRHTPVEVGEILLGVFWEVLATYPVQARPSRVAANLIRDTRMVLLRGHGRRSAEPGLVAAGYEQAEVVTDYLELLDRCPPVMETAADHVYFAAGEGGAAVLEALLGWAVAGGVLTDDEAGLLLDICGPEPTGRDLYAYAAAAQARDLTVPAARQRVSRAVRRLRAATAAHAMDLYAPEEWPTASCHTSAPAMT